MPFIGSRRSALQEETTMKRGGTGIARRQVAIPPGLEEAPIVTDNQSKEIYYA